MGKRQNGKDGVVQLSTSTLYRIRGIVPNMPEMALPAHFVAEEPTPQGRKISFEVHSAHYRGKFNVLDYQIAVSGKSVRYDPKTETVH
jgi:hypothetical protein